MARSALFRMVKYAGEAVLASLPSRVPSGSSLILAYHNIVLPQDVGFGDSSLHLSVEEFRKQLAIAKREADVVSLPDLLAEHGRPGRRIAVTFDDAYTGCIRHGLPACRDADVEPTIFVAPGLLGLFAPWDLWAHQGLWNNEARERFLVDQRGIASVYSCESGEALPVDFRISSMGQLQSAVDCFRLQVGNHTMRHVNLAEFNATEIHKEIGEADMFLATYFPKQFIRQIAYPYGIPPRNERVGAIERDDRDGLLVTGAWLGASEPAQGGSIPRLNVPAGISSARFTSRLRHWFSD